MKTDTTLLDKIFKILLLFLIYSLSVSLILTGRVEDYHIYSFVIILPIFGFLYIYYIKNSKSKYFLPKLLLISTLIKMLFVFIIANYLIDFHGIAFLSYKDDFVYNELAIEISEAWKNRGFGFYDDIRFSTGFYSGYPNVSALGMWMFGKSFYVPRLINVVFSTATVYYFYKTLKIENDEKTARLITTVFAFSLTFIIYASFQFKDTIIVFFLSVLIYYVAIFLKEGGSLKIIVGFVFSSVMMLFFRAATLLPIITALILIYLFIGKFRGFSIKNIGVLLIVFIGFIYIWDYFNSIGLLGYDTLDYFEHRFGVAGSEGARTGSSSLSSLGLIEYILGPIYMIFSIFLPTPVVVNLTPNFQSLNSHYIPLIQYYAILPIGVIGGFKVLKNRKVFKIGFFILAFVIIYKLGQSLSKSVFDSRQSLPAIYGMYLLVPYSISTLNNKFVNKKKERRIAIISVVIMMIVLFAFSYFRLEIRGYY